MLKVVMGMGMIGKILQPLLLAMAMGSWLGQFHTGDKANWYESVC